MITHEMLQQPVELKRAHICCIRFPISALIITYIQFLQIPYDIAVQTEA